MKIQILCFFLILNASARLYQISITPCSSLEYFNSITMKCQNCTGGMVGNWTNCICPPGTESSAFNSTDGSTNLNINPACNSSANCPANDGSKTQPCITNCSSNTIFNNTTMSCQWCGVNTNTTVNGTCVCNDNYTRGVGGCYSLSQTTINPTSKYIAYLPQNYAGCINDNDIQSCSFLMNICLFSLLYESFCNNLNTNQVNLFTTQSSYSATASLSSSGGVSALSMILMKFLPTGQYYQSKSFSLNDVLYCESRTDYSFKIGNAYEQSCLFNFNNVLQMMISKVQREYTYSLFLADQSGNYSIIPVQTNANGKTVLLTRFFIADMFSVPLTGQLTVMNSFTLQITLNNDKQLVSPKLLVSYIHLNINSAGVLTSPLQTVSYKINYNYDVKGFYNVALPLFIVFIVIAMIQAAVRTYIAYLNKRSPFIYIIYFAQNWTSWMFVLLLGLTGYWFFFTKATTEIYVLMPMEGKLYPPFIGVVVTMVLVRALVVAWIKYDSFKTDIFFIDWEISPVKNCWRQIFIANSLSQFFTFRTISFGWILVWTIFFLVGLGWQNQGKISTSLRSWTLFSSQNSILLFFIGCSVLFLIGIVFKILRKLVMTWWPHPFDDFVDLCCLANISVYFPRRNSSSGYYIHGNNASGSQITLFELNNAILKGQLRKTNSLWNPGVSVSEANTFIIYTSNQLKNKLSNLRKEDQQMSYALGKKKGYIQLFKSRQSFINNDLKKTFLNLPKQRNQLLQRTLIQEYLGIPPVNQNERKDSITLAADTNFSICDIFPNSDEFADILTYCILFGALNVALKSSAISAFLSYLILQWIVQAILGKAARVHIEYCTKVKQGFML